MKEIHKVAFGQPQFKKKKKDAGEVKGKCLVEVGNVNVKFDRKSGKPPRMPIDFVDPHFGNYLHSCGTQSHNNE